VLLRQIDDELLAISQPAHAAVSAILAAAWGNPEFGAIEPYDEVCLGAALHDIGWLEWENAPTLNRDTGYPHTFLQLPTMMHLSIWGPASRLALPFGRYAALLVSMHGTALYAFHDYTRDTEEEAQAARAFVAGELAFQEDVLRQLSSDPAMARYASETQVQRNQRLVATWDGMSLALCGGLTSERTFRNVPTSGSVTDVTYTPSGTSIQVSPWPFSTDSVTVRFEGRVLTERFADEERLRQAWRDAEWRTVEARLVPAGTG
jgi:hypothetical protein